MKKAGLALLLLGLLALAARGQTTNPSPAAAADQHYQAGLNAQDRADLALNSDQARRLYRTAVAEYQIASKSRPDHYDAHLNWAMCLKELAPLAADPDARNATLMEASQRFAVASRCPQADYVVFQEWAGLLIGSVYDLVPDQANRVTVLKEVRDVCARGLTVTTEPTPRAELERLLGGSLMMLAEFSADPAEQRARLTEAIDHLRAAGQSVTVRDSLYENGNLGIALLSLGRFTNNPELLRQAAAEFAAARQVYPNNVTTCYNLAATWSLLGDTAAAARYLALVIDQDPTGSFHQLAERDPDLAAVRATPAYTAAVDRRRRETAETQTAALLEQASAALAAADSTNDLPVLVGLLRQAARLSDEAIRLTPAASRAHALGATALARLAALGVPQSTGQREFAAAARARFAAAAKCPGPDDTVFERWGAFLLQTLYPLAPTPAEQEQLLVEARQVFAEGIKHARFSEGRGQLEMNLATCLVLLAQTSATVTNPAALYREAARRFQTAAAAPSVNRSPGFDETWGVALLRAGQAQHDPLLLRQATARLLRAIELDPRNALAHYHLAGAYAQLRQTDLALRHLQTSFDLDPASPLRHAARQDPALEPLRRSLAFRELVGDLSPPRLTTPAKISEK